MRKSRGGGYFEVLELVIVELGVILGLQKIQFVGKFLCNSNFYFYFEIEQFGSVIVVQMFVKEVSLVVLQVIGFLCLFRFIFCFVIYLESRVFFVFLFNGFVEDQAGGRRIFYGVTFLLGIFDVVRMTLLVRDSRRVGRQYLLSWFCGKFCFEFFI